MVPGFELPVGWATVKTPGQSHRQKNDFFLKTSPVSKDKPQFKKPSEFKEDKSKEIHTNCIESDFGKLKINLESFEERHLTYATVKLLQSCLTLCDP